MKKIFYSIFSLFLLFSSSYIYASDIEDTQIIDELNKQNTQELDIDFNLKSFKSCEEFDDVMSKYIKNYWKAHKESFKKNYYYDYDVIGLDESVDGAMDAVVDSKSSGISSQELKEKDYSETNTQVSGVDESDIIKTDGEYIYYYNQNDRYVYIVKSYPTKDLEVIKKIKLSDSFYNPVLYLGDDRLVIIASGYMDYYSTNDGYWIDRNSKTYTIIYDTTDKSNLKLLKLNISDGNFTKSRKIGDYLYVLTNNYFQIPYYNFKTEDDINVDFDKLMPKSLEISKTDDSSKQNLKLKGKKYPYELKAGNITNCNEVEYVLPDEETLKKYDFNPSYNIISVYNINDTEEDTKTKVIAGSNSEIYMSLDNLYLTANMYQSYNFYCPDWADCMMPYYYRGENTLIHKINFKGNELSYDDSSIVPGSPLNQYSMDENDGYFRIITSRWYPNRQTDLYVLDKDFKLAGSLTGLGKTEDFKSSRFIGDKLFLVTFKQIDPLFVIDLEDQTKPKILGELKIPGYSTYLHPYDENHLIGIGYDTTENQWGGTINNGVKVDLYEVDYSKKSKTYFVSDANDCTVSDYGFDCSEGMSYFEDDKGCGCEDKDNKGIYVKQKYSLTLGEYGSYSEALDNPRMFMWNSNKNILFLPASLYKNEKDDYYKHIDFFNGLSAISIDKDSGIKEKWRVTHIDLNKVEDDRKTECKNYSVDKDDCVNIIGGGEYCAPSGNKYVPEYCYEDSSLGEYLSSRYWDYYNDYVKRALWIGDNVYSISDSMIGISDMNSGDELGNIKFK